MSWMEIIQTVWPIMAAITPLVMAGGFAWLRMQFPTKADLEALRADREKASAEARAETNEDAERLRQQVAAISDRLIASEQRIKAVETDLERAPSKIELSKDIGKVAERVGHLEAGVMALTRQIETHNSYLHTLIEKHID